MLLCSKAGNENTETATCDNSGGYAAEETNALTQWLRRLLDALDTDVHTAVISRRRNSGLSC